MIKYLEKTARTEDAAIAEALKELGLDRDDVSVEILERAKSGFLGIGASPARIRVSYEAPDEQPAPAPVKAETPKAEKKAEPKAKPEKKAEAPKAVVKAAPADPNEPAEYAEIRAFLSGLLERMGVNAEIEISPRENGGVNVNLTGAAMGAIIGRRGGIPGCPRHRRDRDRGTPRRGGRARFRRGGRGRRRRSAYRGDLRGSAGTKGITGEASL